MKFTSVLPGGWYEGLLDKADLEASFAALEGSHFYVDAMRGRIRSLQLRIDEAWEHLERAARLARKEPESIPNLARQFMVSIYLFENALVAEAVDRTGPAPELRIPEFPERLVRENPEIRYVLELRLSAEGCLRLHLGDYHHAATIFQVLIDTYARPPDASLAMHYSGLAAAQYNLWLRDLAERSLENAALALNAGGKTLNRVKAAGILAALSSYLGRASETSEWREYLGRLECPDATKDAFLRRGDILLERCAAQKCLLVF